MPKIAKPKFKEPAARELAAAGLPAIPTKVIGQVVAVQSRHKPANVSYRRVIAFDVEFGSDERFTIELNEEVLLLCEGNAIDVGSTLVFSSTKGWIFKEEKGEEVIVEFRKA